MSGEGASLSDRPEPHNIVQNRLLAKLPPEEYRDVAAVLRRVPLDARQVLHRQDEPIDDVYFPMGGACSMTRQLHDGLTAEIATIGNEGVIGAGVFFGDDLSFSETLVQVAGDGGLAIATASFKELMARRGRFYNVIVRYNQALMTQIMQTTVCNGLHSAEQRCCRWLMMTRDRVGTDEFPLTHEFLALMLGVRRPTVTLVMAALQRSGLITHRRAMITIVDPNRLERASCECYGTVKNTFRKLLPELGDASFG